MALEQSAQAAQPSGSLRESVLAGRFFGDRHADTAAELAAFLHGGLDLAALQAWFGEPFQVSSPPARCGRRSTATSPRSMRP